MKPASRRPRPWVAGLLPLLALLLAACGGQQVSVTRLVEVTRLVTVPAAASTNTAPSTRLVVVTATPSPARETVNARDDPGHYHDIVENGPLTLDPALAADSASRQLIQNVVEPLLLPHPDQPATLLPILATRWLTSENGLTYTFLIRQGVSFSNGNELTAADVAYTFQRGLLQSAPGGPFTHLLDPLLGYTSGDITEEIESGLYAGDRDALLASAPARDLRAICEKVKAAIVADDAAGTVTFTLARRWAAFPAALSQPWTGILDSEWAAAQGAWDGSCQTWGAWYAPASDESLLATKIMGTGPYILDHWTPGVEYALVRNRDYWQQTASRTPDGGPVTTPSIGIVTVRQEADLDARWQALRTGSVESAELPPATQPLVAPYVGEICTWLTGRCRPTENADGLLRQFSDLTLPNRHALFFNFEIAADDNPFIGSGQLDGEGVPPDFFGDEHVRRAFAHCFDQDQYIEAALAGNGQPAETLLPAYYGDHNGLPANPAYDLEACAEELATAWDNLLPAAGFRLQIPYESSDPLQQQAAMLLQEGLQAVASNYHVEIVGLSRPAYLQRFAAGQLPLALLGWTIPFPDPHSWVAPAFADEVLAFQHLPSDLATRFSALVNNALSTLGPAARLDAYHTVEAQRRELLPHILLPERTGSHYEQRRVSGWFYQPTFGEPYYDAYSLDGSG